jgi:hypothetical protein
VGLAVRAEQKHLGIFGEREAGEVEADRLRTRRGDRHGPHEAAIQVLQTHAVIEGLAEGLPRWARDRLHDSDAQGGGAAGEGLGQGIEIILGEVDPERRKSRARRHDGRDRGVELPLTNRLLGNGEAAACQFRGGAPILGSQRRRGGREAPEQENGECQNSGARTHSCLVELPRMK